MWTDWNTVGYTNRQWSCIRKCWTNTLTVRLLNISKVQVKIILLCLVFVSCGTWLRGRRSQSSNLTLQPSTSSSFTPTSTCWHRAALTGTTRGLVFSAGSLCLCSSLTCSLSLFYGFVLCVDVRVCFAHVLLMQFSYDARDVLTPAGHRQCVCVVL